MTDAAAASGRSARLWRRTRVGTTLAAAVVALVWMASLPAGRWLVLAVGAALAVRAVVELVRMGLLGWREGVALWVAVALVAGYMLASFSPRAAPRPLVWHVGSSLGLALLPAALLAFKDGRRAAAPLAAAAWIAFPLPALFLVRVAFGTEGLVALLLLSKVGDVAGYYVGSSIGRRRPFPRLSPGKTVAGCVGSLIAGTAVGGGLAAAGVLPLGIAAGLGAGALVNLAAQGGDLLESGVKRRAGVKDSAATFGPSGGVLDLVDSLLLSVPVALVTWPLLFAHAAR